MNTLDITLTSSQLLNLKTTPVQLIPAPGSGNIALPFLIFMRLYAGGIAYETTGSALGLIINSTNIYPAQAMSTSFLGSTTDQFSYYVFNNTGLLSAGIDVSSFENQATYIQNTGFLPLLLGNGTADIQIQWDTFNV